ncbi:MAG TPA: hypothetical protein VK590_04275 [Saprospiraceae bacterium]|nr:hypothetical protein [Saprospiraceae bacterium]
MKIILTDYKSVYRITIFFCFSLLVLLSILIWKERIFFIDPAFHLFLMIKDGTFPIQVQRFGAALTMFLPIIGIKIGLSTTTLALLYSLNIGLYYAFLALLNIKLNPDCKLAFALFLCYTILMSFSFFWIQAELPMGLALSITFINYLDKLKLKAWKAPSIFCTLIILITCIYFHPIVSIFLVFLLVFKYLDATTDKKTFTIGLLLLLSLVIVKKLAFKTTYYDINWMNDTLANLKLLYPHYLSNISNKQFLTNLIPQYILLIPAILGIVIYYIIKRSWKKLNWTIFCFFGYLLLVNITCNKIMPLFHIESFYLPLAGILSIPLALDVLPSLNKKILISVMLIFVFYKLIQLNNTYKIVHKRLEIITNILHKTNKVEHKKILFASSQLPMDSLIITWPISYEVLMLSIMENKQNPRNVLVLDDPHSRDSLLTKPLKEFAGTFKSIPYSKFPINYFSFKDTSSFVLWSGPSFK